MSTAKKAKLNISVLSTFLKRLLIGLGVITIISYLTLSYLKIEGTTLLYFNTASITVGLIIGLIYANTSKTFKH